MDQFRKLQNIRWPLRSVLKPKLQATSNQQPDKVRSRVGYIGCAHPIDVLSQGHVNSNEQHPTSPLLNSVCFCQGCKPPRSWATSAPLLWAGMPHTHTLHLAPGTLMREVIPQTAFCGFCVCWLHSLSAVQLTHPKSSPPPPTQPQAEPWSPPAPAPPHLPWPEGKPRPNGSRCVGQGTRRACGTRRLFAQETCERAATRRIDGCVLRVR